MNVKKRSKLLSNTSSFVEILNYFNLNNEYNTAVKSKNFEDNNGCISTATAPKLSARTKYICIKYHFVYNFFGPNRLANHPFILEKINTKLQKTDIFIKGLTKNIFQNLQKCLCD